MEHAGYGVTVKGKPHGIWPLSLGQARHSAERYKATGFADVGIVAVHAGAKVPLTDPAPIFPERTAA
jgi:hypothetical protein